jgi:hypothetical protein
VHRTRRANEEAAFERLAEWLATACEPIKKRKATGADPGGPIVVGLEGREAGYSGKKS